jgi:hypothetical protein
LYLIYNGKLKDINWISVRAILIHSSFYIQNRSLCAKDASVVKSIFTPSILRDHHVSRFHPSLWIIAKRNLNSSQLRRRNIGLPSKYRPILFMLTFRHCYPHRTAATFFAISRRFFVVSFLERAAAPAFPLRICFCTSPNRSDGQIAFSSSYPPCPPGATGPAPPIRRTPSSSLSA